MNKTVISAAVLSATVLSGHTYASDAHPDLRGLLEVGISADQISAPKMELGFNSQLNERVYADMVVLYEGGATAIDTAEINFAPRGENWSMSLGYLFVPFGSFDTAMASDPLNKSLAETREQALRYDLQLSNLSTSIYLFNGTNDAAGKSALDNFGLQFTHGSELMTTSLGYISDIGDSNGLQQAINTQLGNNITTAQVPGLSISLSLHRGPIAFQAGFVTAQTAFQAGQVEVTAVQPSTTSMELAYTLNIAGNESLLAFATQSSADANTLGIAQARTMVALNTILQQGARLILEVSQDTDYNSVVTTAYMAKFQVEF